MRSATAATSEPTQSLFQEPEQAMLEQLQLLREKYEAQNQVACIVSTGIKGVELLRDRVQRVRIMQQMRELRDNFQRQVNDIGIFVSFYGELITKVENPGQYDQLHEVLFEAQKHRAETEEEGVSLDGVAERVQTDHECFVNNVKFAEENQRRFRALLNTFILGGSDTNQEPAFTERTKKIQGVVAFCLDQLEKLEGNASAEQCMRDMMSASVGYLKNFSVYLVEFKKMEEAKDSLIEQINNFMGDSPDDDTVSTVSVNSSNAGELNITELIELMTTLSNALSAGLDLVGSDEENTDEEDEEDSDATLLVDVASTASSKTEKSEEGIGERQNAFCLFSPSSSSHASRKRSRSPSTDLDADSESSSAKRSRRLFPAAPVRRVNRKRDRSPDLDPPSGPRRRR